jgi:16S rRNA (cytidine1402-2'-O)-methyltransferase
MLAVVPTPLGNLEDMPPRALRVLREAKAVYCEDTRRTRALLTHFGISTPALRYNEHDERDAARVVARLRAGENIALVSDSGLPGVSDPGQRLVALARAEKLPVSALPGPSAAVTAVAGSGLPGGSFIFLGFLPRSAGRKRRALQEAAVLLRTIVIYESPFRIVDLLEHAAAALGPKARACVVRELSKVHEEWLTGTVAEVLGVLAARPKILGEFVAVLHPSPEPGNG